jgi:hypothetical protein
MRKEADSHGKPAALPAFFLLAFKFDILSTIHKCGLDGRNDSTYLPKEAGERSTAKERL